MFLNLYMVIAFCCWLFERTDFAFMIEVGEGEKSDMPFALVDTACTRCMHRERWRRRFEEKCLKPRGLRAEVLEETRSFTSAFGHKAKGQQMRIPVAFGGYRGEVVSTEMPDCDTPLLISLATQVALDASFHTKARLGDKVLGCEVAFVSGWWTLGSASRRL